MLNFRRISWLIVLGGLVLGGVQPQPTAAQDDYAATLTIVQAGVSVRRAGTLAWLPVRAGAVMPLGEGDQVRTGAGARARIEFWQGGELLLLPYSTYQQGRLIAGSAADDRHLAGRLDGTAVHRFDALPAVYELALEDGVILTPARQFATWSRTGEPDAVVVHDGTLTLDTGTTRVQIDANHGWYAGEEPVRLDPPINAAALTAYHTGCAGVVRINLRSLNVREGPGQGYIVIGYIPNGESVSVLGINQSSGWYRVRLNSHFGWAETLAVRARCDDLPRFADTTREFFLQVAGATDQEREWLQPYFGSPADDPWFYRP